MTFHQSGRYEGVILLSHSTVLETDAWNKKKKKKDKLQNSGWASGSRFGPPPLPHRAQAIFSSSEQRQEHQGQNIEEYSTSFICRLR